MSKPLQVRVLSSTGRYRHLGAVERGLKTACGRIFEPTKTLIELPGSVDVSCLRCQSTNDYARAVASGQIPDMRART